MQGKGGSIDIRELRKQIQDYMTKAETILERLPNPTRETFQRFFKSETNLFASQKTDVSIVWDPYVLELEKEDRIKTAINMSQALKSFRKYKRNLYFEDINPAFLKGYVNWIIEQGLSKTTAQIYIRSMRTIFNRAIKDGLVPIKLYPFKAFTIGSSIKSKGVLYSAHIKAICEYEGNCMSEDRAVKYWLFSYLGSGLNFTDLARLKWSNINGSILTFAREKTKRTNKVSGKEIKVYMLPELKYIIQKYGNPKRNPNDYLFPIISDELTALQKQKKIASYQHRVNRYLRRVGDKLRLGQRLTLSLARHSFATSLKLSNTPVAAIMDCLGHSNLATTMHYMKSIPDQNIKAISETLLKF